jgi:hypothetical protein
MRAVFEVQQAMCRSADMFAWRDMWFRCSHFAREGMHDGVRSRATSLSLSPETPTVVEVFV